MPFRLHDGARPAQRLCLSDVRPQVSPSLRSAQSRDELGGVEPAVRDLSDRRSRAARHPDQAIYRAERARTHRSRHAQLRRSGSADHGRTGDLEAAAGHDGLEWRPVVADWPTAGPRSPFRPGDAASRHIAFERPHRETYRACPARRHAAGDDSCAADQTVGFDGSGTRRRGRADRRDAYPATAAPAPRSLSPTPRAFVRSR